MNKALVETQAVIQARMTSTRLFGKVLLELGEKPVLEHVVRRTAASSQVDRIIVATTIEEADNPIVEWCGKNNVNVFRGPKDDVLERYIKCLEEWPSKRIVRITADCPLIDPGTIDAAVFLHKKYIYDYVSNVQPPTFPHGLDVEVVSSEVLKLLGEQALLPSHREHVTLFIRENSACFKTANLEFGRDASKYRITLDRPEDYAFFEAFFKLVPPQIELISLYEILRLLESHPELTSINSGQDRYEGVKRSAAAEGRALNI